MHDPVPSSRHRDAALAAGLLYAAIILLGLTSELVLRAPLMVTGDAGETAARLASMPGRLASSVLADAAMVAADVALAALLFVIFRQISEGLAALAALFRLIQAAVIAAGLPVLWSAGAWSSVPNGEDQAMVALMTHAAGYDLGLIFFGMGSILVAALMARHHAFPKALSLLMASAGLVYLTGSTLRIVAPELVDAFQPFYLVAILAEAWFAVALLRLGFGGRFRKTRKIGG